MRYHSDPLARLMMDPQRKADDRESVMNAIQAIRDRSTEATALAGLLVDGRSPERVRQEEDRLFVGFSLKGETDSLTQPMAADRIGRTIVGPESTDQPPVPTMTPPAPAAPRTVQVVTPPASIPSMPGTAPDAGS
ncbi:hypothetical protein GI374_12490 [Paracoccus sp. S-4012]|nr:hypothetical protein [Paracoccus sp. S-4012]